MADQVSLFVYGSFSKGMVHFDRLNKYVSDCLPATVRGSIYRLQVGYPAFLSEGETPIRGQLLKLEAPDVLFKILDEFHGFSPLAPEKSLYWKTDIQATFDDGTVEEAFVYALNPSKLPKTAMLIEDGDWEGSLRGHPAMTHLLTDRQAEYVRRLGASTGRDIVPIDLDLYRELMKLELIVDKGRRLALTRFGKEVYRFL